MSKKYNWLRFIPLYGGVIVLFLSRIKGEINNMLYLKLMIKTYLLRFALPFYMVVVFFALTKSWLSFSSTFVSLGIYGSIIALGFFTNKFIFVKLNEILENPK